MRQLTMNKYEIGVQELREAPDGRYDMVRVKYGTIEASSLTKTEIRTAIKEMGMPVPRGTDVFAEKVGSVRYYFDTEDLIAIAKKVEEIPLENE